MATPAKSEEAVRPIGLSFHRSRHDVFDNVAHVAVPLIASTGKSELLIELAGISAHLGIGQGNGCLGDNDLSALLWRLSKAPMVSA
jgi:hypothetical protein